MPNILITGSSTGIGKATALVLARAGHTVYASMRNPERSPGLKEIAEKEKLPVIVLTMDVDHDDSIRDATEKILNEASHIDVLINNAGIGTNGAIEELTMNDFKQTMETNFFGAIRCIHGVLPSMRKHRRGCIINITSIAGKIANTPQGAYASSKFALEALSEVLAIEVKPYNIRVAIVEPEIIKTPIFKKMKEVPSDTNYPHQRRLEALLEAALQNPVLPEVVGEQILQIVESDSWQLRYPTGPGAEPFLKWRAQIPDEEWVALNAIEDDEKWCAHIEKDLGINVRPYLKK